METIPAKCLIFIFLASLFILSYAALFHSQHPSFHWDAAHYSILSSNLAEGNGFSNEPGHPTAYRTPIYPVFVSLVFRVVGERYKAVYLFQALLAALTATGAAWLAYLTVGKRAMFITGTLAALNPSAIQMTGLLLTEITFGFLIVCCVLILYSVLSKSSNQPGTGYYFGFAAAGLAFGIATLCRPIAAVWAILASGFILFRRGHRIPFRIISVVVFLVGLSLPVLPWMARNNALFGTTSVVTTGGRTFWEFRHRDVEATADKGTPPAEFTRANDLADQRSLAESGGDPSRMIPVYNLCPQYHAFFHDQTTINRFLDLSEGEADKEFYRMGIAYTINHPFRVLLESLRDVLKIFSPLNRTGSVNPVLFIAIPFVLMGLYRMYRLNTPGGAAIVTGLLSLAIVSFLILYEPRYRIPYEPLMMLAAGVGIDGVLKNGVRGREGILLATGYLLFAAASYATLSGQVTT